MHPTPRVIRLLTTSFVLLGATVLLGSAPQPHPTSAIIKPRAQATAQGQTIDTVLVYGPTRCQITSGTSGGAYLTFSTTPVAGRRYLLQVTNGNANGTNRVTGGFCFLNGNELEGVNGLTSSVPSLTRITKDVTASNTLELEILGSVGAFIDVRVVHVPDDHYTIWGPHTFTKPVGAPVDQTQTFALPSGSPSPYTMYVTNGQPDGTKRTTATKITLNRVDILNGMADLGDPVASTARGVALQAQDTLVVRMINEKLTVDPPSQVAVSFAATDTTAPVLAVSAPARESLLVVDSVLVSGTVSEPQTALTLTVAGQSVTPAQNGAFSKVIALGSDGRQGIHVVASNTAGFTVDSVRYVTRDTQAPVLVVTSPALDVTTTTGDTTTVAGTWSDASISTVTVNGEQVGSGASGSFSYSVNLAMGANTIVVRGTDGLGRVSRVVRTVIRNASNEPDPLVLDLPTPIAPTEISGFAQRNAFLFPKQGVPLGAIRDTLMSVIRGKVVHATFGADTLYPLANVVVGVDGHPEWGSTRSRADGEFDLAVNGGGALVLKFSKTEFIPVQRKIELPWNDFVRLDPVAMRGRDTRSTAISAGDTASRIASGSLVDDSRGRRRGRVLFKPGTTARVVNAPGDTTAPLSSYTVRLSEYTAGATGELAMPADLPATTAYTYCVDLGLDEAPNKEVVFSQPVVFYVDNFLHFRTGRVAPVGSLESTEGRWQAEPDGRVVKILSFANGTANIDVTGDDVAETPAELAAVGIDFEERRRLAGSAFAVGDTLWRAELAHFSSVDINFPFAMPEGARGHQAGRPTARSPRVNNCSECTGSVIQIQNQALVEEIPVVGTPWALHFSSERTKAYRIPFQLRIPLSDTVPTALRRIEVKIDVAGRRFERKYASSSPGSLSNLPPLEWEDWDGKDAYGRDIVGSATARVRIGYVFQNRYASAGGGLTYTGTNFGAPLRVGQVQELTPLEGTVWTDYSVKLGNVRNAYAGLGSWSLTPHHIYDPNEPGTLYLGSGETAIGERNGPVVDDAHVVVLQQDPNLLRPVDYAVGPDGTEYVATQGTSGINARIWTWTSTGWVVLAGGGSDDVAEGLPAAQVKIATIEGLACGPDGSVYFSESAARCRVRRIAPDRRVWTVAGGLSCGASGDDGPALAAGFSRPIALAVGADSSVFVVDDGAVRRISPDGIIRRVAGTGMVGDGDGDADDSAIGTTTQIYPAFGRIAATPDGGFLLADQLNGKLRRLFPSGELRTLARLPSVASVAVAPDGSIYAATSTRVFELDRYGVFVPVACDGVQGDGDVAPGPALTARARDIRALVVTPGLGLRFLHRWDESPNRPTTILEVHPALPGGRLSETTVAARDRSEVYVFDSNGRHLRTLDGLTGGVRYAFDYQSYAGRPYLLTTITDMNAQTTTVTRDPATGDPTAIQAPFGRVTTLHVVNSGERPLDRVTNPDGDVVELEPDPASEVLTRMKDPRGYWHRYQYDAAGRLAGDFAPDSFATTISLLSPPADSVGDRTVIATSRLGRVSQFGVDFLSALKTERRVDTGPDGMGGVQIIDGAGRATSQSPDGTTTSLVPGPDPRDGMMAPFVRSFTLQRGSTTTQVSDTVVATGFAGFGSQLKVNGRVYTTGFGTMGQTRTLYLTPPEGALRQMQITMDEFARPLVTTRPGGLASITTTYNLGRVDGVQVGGRFWDCRYDDGTGRLTSLVDPLNRQTSFYYDGADRLTRQVLPGLSEINYTYDDAGNLLTLTPPGRSAHEFAYTPGNQTRMYRPPGGGADSTHYEYNADRQLTRIDTPDSQSVRLVYDAVKGRLDSLATTRGEALGFTYSGSTGQLTRLTHLGADGTELAFGYGGPLLEGESWSGSVSGSVNVTYDANFWPTTQTVTAGASSAVTHHYDDDGLIEDIAIGSQTYDLTPDPATGLLTATSLGSLATTASYNTYAELDSTRATVGGMSLYAAQYERDDLGRITRLTEMVQGQTSDRRFEYDLLGRLWQVRDATTDAQLERYAYGTNSNRDTAVVLGGPVRYAEYDSLDDRQLTDDSATFTYTGAGERRRRVDGAQSQTTTYDALGNLRTVDLWDGTQITYIVDGRNRRVGRKVNGVWTHRWLYQNGLSVVAELDDSGALRKRFVYGSRGHVPDVMVLRNSSGPDSAYRMITDHLGSARLVVNTSSGWVAQRLSYDTWGNVTEDTNPGFQPFGYVGSLYDATTRLARFGVRDYDARTGRWLAKESSVLAGGSANLYEYVLSDPVNNYDVDGNDVVIYHYPSGPGHLGLGVDGGASVGYYPTDRRHFVPILKMLVGTAKGSVRSDLPNVLARDRSGRRSIVIVTTPSQDARIAEYIRTHRRGRFGLFGENCVRFVRNALAAGGVYVHSGEWRPSEFFDDIWEEYGEPNPRFGPTPSAN